MSVTDPYTLESKEKLFLLASGDQGPKDRKNFPMMVVKRRGREKGFHKLAVLNWSCG